MSLRWKIVAILAVCAVLYTALVSLVIFLVILPSFAQLELAEGKEDLHRLREQVNREVQALDILCADWAAWDDMYQFVAEPDPDRVAAYQELNLNLLWYRQNRLNLLYVLGAQGNVVWGRTFKDPMAESAAPVPVPEFAGQPWPLSHPLLCRPPDWRSMAGVFPTSLGLMMVSCRPITDTRMQAQPRGTLIMGRLIDQSMITQICSLAQVKGDLLSVSQGFATPELRVEREPKVIRLYKTLPGVLGKPALVVRADIPRDIMRRGKAAVLFALVSILLAAVLSFALILALLRWAVVFPLGRLTQHLTGVALDGKLNLLDIPGREDEFAVLAREFNRMINRIQLDNDRRHATEAALRESHALVLRTQHLAELGEMGATIAHEIRNPISGISSAVQILRDTCPPSGPRLPIIDEILQNVDRVEAIVQRALAFAKTWEPQKQQTDLYALTLKIFEQARARRPLDRIELTVQHRPSLFVSADPVLIEQVLWNMLENSIEAVRDSLDAPQVSCRFEESTDFVRIILADTGSGIAPEANDKLFKAFFTTKPNGTGLGLVVCKRIVEAHGGKINLCNRNVPGAEAVVELPKGS